MEGVFSRGPKLGQEGRTGPGVRQRALARPQLPPVGQSPKKPSTEVEEVFRPGRARPRIPREHGSTNQ